ncbi:hypothetical protein JB92DRAFT_2914810 [Gautieria morchelliformis]|nr:hypothetical protein JB92DRAFT_2914810 [Gautieria morchelliformis]
MRKTPYLISFLFVSISFSLSFVSFEVPEWVFAQSPKGLPGAESVRWGLYQRCDRTIVYDGDSTDQYYTEYNCRPFPSKKYRDCQREVDNYCILWDTAGYASQLSLVFAAAALVSLLVVSTGFSTRSRRRTAWQGVAALTGLHGALQIITMAIIVCLHSRSAYPLFGEAKLSTSFYLSTISWSLDVFIIAGLLYTAFAAKSGKRWAAGRRGYQPIPG